MDIHRTVMNAFGLRDDRKMRQALRDRVESEARTNDDERARRDALLLNVASGHAVEPASAVAVEEMPAQSPLPAFHITNGWVTDPPAEVAKPAGYPLECFAYQLSPKPVEETEPEPVDAFVEPARAHHLELPLVKMPENWAETETAIPGVEPDVEAVDFSGEEALEPLSSLSALAPFAPPEPEPELELEPAAQPVEPVAVIGRGDQYQMPALKDELNELLKIEGVHTALVVTRDGFVIEGVSQSETTQVDAAGAVVSSGISSWQAIGHDLGVGAMSQSMVEYEGGIAVATLIGKDAILGVVADIRANLGNLRYQVKKRASEIEKLV